MCIDNEENKMNEKSKLKLKELMTGDKFRNILIILLIVSVGVIFVSSQFDSMDTKTHESTFDTEAYRESVTEELYSMVTSISGVGEAKVMLTLENSYEYVYLDDDKTLRKINEPQVRGVVIACTGGESAVVREEITELVRTALNVPASKVSIKKLK